LTPKTRKQFLAKKIKYSRRILADNVERFLRTELQDEATQEDLLQVVVD